MGAGEAVPPSLAPGHTLSGVSTRAGGLFGNCSLFLGVCIKAYILPTYDFSFTEYSADLIAGWGNRFRRLVGCRARVLMSKAGRFPCVTIIGLLNEREVSQMSLQCMLQERIWLPQLRITIPASILHGSAAHCRIEFLKPAWTQGNLMGHPAARALCDGEVGF